jgi:hypothetical protein
MIIACLWKCYIYICTRYIHVYACMYPQQRPFHRADYDWLTSGFRGDFRTNPYVIVDLEIFWATPRRDRHVKSDCGKTIVIYFFKYVLSLWAFAGGCYGWWLGWWTFKVCKLRAIFSDIFLVAGWLPYCFWHILMYFDIYFHLFPHISHLVDEFKDHLWGDVPLRLGHIGRCLRLL